MALQGSARRSVNVDAPLPIDEASRLSAVRRLRLAGHGPDTLLDAVACLAAAVLDVPFAQVSLVDSMTQTVLGSWGPDLPEQSREAAFASHVILAEQPLVVGDITVDARFRSHDLAVGGAGIRAWVGVPVIAPDGHAVGAIVGLDVRERGATPDQLVTLAGLAALVAAHLEGKSLADRVVAHVQCSPEVAGEGDGELAAVAAGTLQAVVDHGPWPLAWAHVRVGRAYQVVGSLQVDPRDLDTGLALYEMRHRIEERGSDGAPYVLQLDQVPSSLARLAGQSGAEALLVVPVEIDARRSSVLVLGVAAPVSTTAFLASLGALARRVAAKVQMVRGAGAGQRAEDVSEADLHVLRAIDDVRHHLTAGLALSLRRPLHLSLDMAEQLRKRPALAHNPSSFARAIERWHRDDASEHDDTTEHADIAELVARATRNAVRGHGRPVALTLRLQDVHADVEVARLERAVEAMVDNAVRHTPAGTSIEVMVRRISQDRLRVVVMDDGIGLPDAVKHRIFLPHDPPATETGRARRSCVGAGLGIVAAVAALHEGIAWVDDRPTGGARFNLEMPIRDLAAKRSARQLADEHPGLRLVRASD